VMVAAPKLLLLRSMAGRYALTTWNTSLQHIRLSSVYNDIINDTHIYFVVQVIYILLHFKRLVVGQ
jgi:hypothetical protein